MKKSLIAKITIVSLVLSLLSGIVFSVGAADQKVYVRDMTASSPKGTYYVATEADLNQLAVLVNNGMAMSGYTFLQTQNITLTAENFTPIGTQKPSAPFRGTYDGQRHKISNLQIYDASRDGAALFGYAYYATVKNLGIESGSVTAANRAGGIAGYGDGSVFINCYNKASISIISGVDGVGGIAGVARGNAKFYGCYNTGTITCVTGGAAGIVGWAGQNENSMVYGSYNAGKIKYTRTLAGSTPLDTIARTSRKVGDYSDCYYLGDVCGTDTDASFNLHNAQKLTSADNLKMAYVLNHATGVNTNAFTLNSKGNIVFSSEGYGVIDLRIKAMVGEVIVEDTDITRVTTNGYTIPATYASREVVSAAAGEKTYKAGDFIPVETAEVLTVTLTLAGEIPAFSDYDENKASDSFTISSVEELAALAKLVDAGNTFEGKTFYVTEDLDFSDYPTWEGIGYSAGSGGGVVAEGSLPFSGTFDGQYHHFKNINFKSKVRYSGIFSYTEGALLKNIIFDEGTIYMYSKTGRASGVLIGLMSNTTVMNMENHVSIYAEQEEYAADNIGFIGMSTNNSVIKNSVNYGEVGLKGKSNSQQNGGFIGYGYKMSSIDNCIAVGEVEGSESDPIARGTTITNCYYLPHRDLAGTMSYDALLSGEAAWILNENSGANLWAKGEEGPALDPDHAVFPVHYTIYDFDAAANETEALISGTLTEYYSAGETVTIPAQQGYTLLNEAKKYWPLSDSYTMPCFEQTIAAWYSHNAYDITYVTNGGVFNADPQAVAITGTATELPDRNYLERSGYSFEGWYDNEALKGEPVIATPVDVYRDVTYYAGWIKSIEISTVEQLAAMELDGRYILTADIDLSKVNFEPIGSYEAPFTGEFDGNGHTISGLNIVSTAEYQGLFGVNAGIIRNLVLDNSSVSGNAYVGGIAGENLGTIENCICDADVLATGTKAQAKVSMVIQNLKVKPAQDRLDNMKKRFDAYDADIMLLQEADKSWIQFLNTNYVNTGEYKMLYKYRYEFSDADAAFKQKYPNESLESTPVLYKPDKFNLIDSGYFWLSETPETVSRPEGATHFRICSWAILQQKSSGRYLAVFSVHLDIGGDAVRVINAQAIMNKAQELRSQYASKDLMTVIAGDYNARIDSNAYKTVFTGGDIVNAVYEITQTITPANIDHVGLSENNIRAVDDSFKYLWGEYDVEPSDHKGIYVELEAVVNTYQGGITGSNFGTVRNSVSLGSVSGTHVCGTMIGRNLGAVEELYYCNGEPFGLTKEGWTANEMKSAKETARALNLSGNYRFTVENDALALVQSGEAPVCITEKAVAAEHHFGAAEEIAPTCVEAGYTLKTCKDCGYQERVVHDAALGHQYEGVQVADDLYHQRTCARCGDIEYAEHQYTTSYVAATCENYGATQYVCACGHSYDVIDDDAKDHIWNGVEQKDEVNHLLVCARDAAHKLQRAHTFETTEVEATCETVGGVTYTCSNCAYSTFVSEGEPLGHSYGAWSPLDAEQHQAVCERDETHIATAPHAFVAVETVVPTCKEEGYTVYVCSDCGQQSRGDIVPTLKHEYSYDAEAKAYVCHCETVYVSDGDVNGDGEANSADAIMVLRRVDGRIGEVQDYAADLNCDGQIKLYDAVMFLRLLANQ